MSQSTNITTKNPQQPIDLSMIAVHTRQPEEAKNNATFNQSVWESGHDLHHKLEIAMKYLNRIDKDAAFYVERSQKIMQHMHHEFHQREEGFLPWARFFDISARKKEDYAGKKEGSQGYLFKKGMEDLIINIFTQNQPNLTMDWKIAKRILSVPHIFPDDSQLLPLIGKETILRAFQFEIDKALGQMIWLTPTILTSLAKGTLQILRDCFNDKASNDLLSQAIIVGRFDKDRFDLKNNSLILGNDGGLYLLLNRLTKEQQEGLVLENIATEAYLKDKIKNRPEDKEKTGDKVILGQGGFGKVRFAISLFGAKAGPGEIVCIKKTSNFEVLSPKNGEMIPSALQSATEATMEDYFASSIADKVYAPRIFDLAIVATRDTKEVSLTHQKGYLMMEVFPQNTATKIFRESKYQQWKYQKPFLKGVWLSTLELLEERIAFTDLKPDNALFDPDTFKTTIIDLGGTIKITAAADSLDNFDKSKYSCQVTEGYCAPEMKDMNIMTISLPKALAYTCGKVMEEVVQKSDYDRIKLKGLIDKLTNPKPAQRLTIEEALEVLKAMGDDTSHKDILLNQYIAKIRGRIENNPTSISLNEDILITKELYMKLEITPRDPLKYENQETEDLFQRIDHFWAVDQTQHQVMAVFGSAGSGKSIALQLKFIEAIQKWEKGQPVPIYFNLANGIELKNIINSMNTELGTNIKLQELEKDVHLYIDSFDEGLEIEKRRETLIRDYMTELKKNSKSVKVLITCRSNYLENDSSHSWFTPDVNAFRKLATCYVAPMSYIKENDSVTWRERIMFYLQSKNKREGIQMNEGEIQSNLERIAIMNLDKLMDTGLMIHIIMEVLPELLKDKNKCRSRSKQDIYLKYITAYQKTELAKLTEEQRLQVLKWTKFISKSQVEGEEERTLIEVLNDLGKYLAVQLHLQDKFRLDQSAPIFQAMGFDNSIHLKKQLLWHVLKLLPLKIETKHSKINRLQEVKLGFMHDTIKNCYLLAAIQDEMSTQNGNSQILSSKSIIADHELVNFIADAACHDHALKNHLRRTIDLTKIDKSDNAALYAANCITILVAARYSFWSQNLSNINIKGANLQNGIFRGTDFTGANLNSTNLRNIQAHGALFIKADLIGARLGILPDLEGHTGAVNCVGFSADGRYVVSASGDKTVKIWEIRTNKCVATLEGHTRGVLGVSYSADGKYVVSASGDETVKIWDVQTNKCVATLQGHTYEVNCVSFSVDGRYVASASCDKTVKIWDVQTNKCVATLEGHTRAVLGVSFSADGRYVASAGGVYDETVKIWDIQTNKCVATLQGHTEAVNSVSFSVDGRYVASASDDKTVKIWDVQSYKCVATLEGHTGEVRGVSYSADGRYVASAGGLNDKTVKIWDVQIKKCVATLQGYTTAVTGVSFSADGRYVASASRDKTVKIWDVQINKSVATLQGHTDAVWGVSFSADGKYVASSGGLSDKTVKIWEVQTNKCVATLEGHTKEVRGVSYSADGRYVASVGSANDRTVMIWEIQTNKCVATLQGHTAAVLGVSLSADGKYVASASFDGTVKIWEVQTNRCVATLEGHTHAVGGVSFSADGRYVASASSDKTVKIWDVQTNKCAATLQGHTKAVNSVSFSADGRYVASASYDETVKIWDVQTNKCAATLQGHTDIVNGVSFSVDGRCVASASKDKTVKIWDVQSYKCVATLEGHTDAVTSVSFSADGRYVASASCDKTVKIWSNRAEQWFLKSVFGGSTELPISVLNAVIEETTISDLNEKAFKQRGAQIKNNRIDNDKAAEMEQDSICARSTADNINEQLLTPQITIHKKNEQQKLVQIDPAIQLKLTKQNQKNNEASINEGKADQQTVVVQQRQNKVLPGVKQMIESKPGKSACCNLF